MYNLAIPDGTFKQLQELKLRTEDKNEAEVIRRALAIYDALTEHVRLGGKVRLIRADSTFFEPEIFG